MKRSTLFILTLLILSISACKDDPCEDVVCQNNGICTDGKCECDSDYEGEFCQNKVYLLKEVYENGELKESIEYNDNNEVAVIQRHFGGNITHTLNHRHYKDSLIVETLYHLTEFKEIWKYTKQNIQTVRLDISNENSSAGSHHLFMNQTFNCGFAFRQSINQDGELADYSFFEFTDANCSFDMERRSLPDNSLIAAQEVLRDDKNYSHKFVKTLITAPSAGNALKWVYFNENKDVIDSISYSSTFTYNEDSYPIMEERNYRDGNVVQRNFEYY